MEGATIGGRSFKSRIQHAHITDVRCLCRLPLLQLPWHPVHHRRLWSREHPFLAGDSTNPAWPTPAHPSCDCTQSNNHCLHLNTQVTSPGNPPFFTSPELYLISSSEVSSVESLVFACYSTNRREIPQILMAPSLKQFQWRAHESPRCGRPGYPVGIHMATKKGGGGRIWWNVIYCVK